MTKPTIGIPGGRREDTPFTRDQERQRKWDEILEEQERIWREEDAERQNADKSRPKLRRLITLRA